MDQVKISLNKLRLENFKGVICKEFAFMGNNASLYGDNAAGKTTVYDALTWLLFGKDSRGQKDFDIKPLDGDGNVLDHAAITCVEAELSVNGIALCLKRTYFEKWSTKRGSSEKTFDGHSSDFFVDGVPCKKNEFERRVEEIVPEDRFLLLTSVSAFAEGMTWQQRREVLFRLAGIHSDREIMATDDRFSALLEAMGTNTLEDYKKRLKAERSGLNTRRTDIPARISENQERMKALQAMDFASLEADSLVLQAQREQVQEQINLVRGNNLAASLRVILGGLQNDLRQLEIENDGYRKKQQVPDEREQLRRELVMEQNNLAFYARRVKMLNASIHQEEVKIEDCRQRWNLHNGRIFQGATCQACGQPLVGGALERARRDFEEKMEQGKEDEVLASAEAKAALNRYRDELAEATTLEADSTRKKAELEARLLALQAEEKPPVEDMPGYAARAQELKQKIDQVNGQIFSADSDVAQQTAALRTQARELDAQLARIREELAKKGLLVDLARRLEELRQEAQAASEAMNKVDGMLFLCDEFTRHKVNFVEDTVNSLFTLAKFRLYREQMNGGVEDRCDVTYQGVPYGSLNNGARINVGLDIIRTLSREHGILVPLFIDNAESVTRLEHTDGQVIRLVVSEYDKELRCEYEN